MPRQASDKSHPGGSNPYPKMSGVSKAQAELIAKAVFLALTASDDADANPQTTYSEDEENLDAEDEDQTSPATLSSSSSNDTFLQATLAPLQMKLQKSEQMLRELATYLPKFVQNQNQDGITQCANFIEKHEAIASETKAQIATAKDTWATQERARKDAEHKLEMEKKEETSKAKGKGLAPRNEEDEELRLLDSLMREVPEGSLFPHPPPTQNTNPELAILDSFLSASPAKTHSPQNTSRLFTANRALPQGFSRSTSQNHNLTIRTPTSQTPAARAGPSTSNPFGATPLNAPEDFSPSKVNRALTSPKPIVARKKETQKKGKKIVSSSTRQGLRTKSQLSYKEEEEDADDNAY